MLGRRAHLDPCEMLSSAVQLQIEDVVGRQPTEAGFAPSEPLGTSESTDCRAPARMDQGCASCMGPLGRGR